MGDVTVTWRIDMEMSYRGEGGVLKWGNAPGVCVPNEGFMREELERLRAQPPVPHLRNPRLIKVTEEVVDA